MEFAKVENLEGLTSSLKPVKRVIGTITENWESWKTLISSLSGLSSSSASSGEDRLLIAVIKILGRLCSEDCRILEEDEISGGGGDDEDEVPEQLLANVLRSVCHAGFFDVVTRKVTSWTMIQPLKSGRSKTPQDCRPRSGEILVCLRDLCGLLMKLMPFTAKDACSSLVLMVLGILQGSYVVLDQPLLLQGFQNIQESIVAVNKEFERDDKEGKPRYGFSTEQELLMHEREPPSNFRDIQVIPTVKELLTDKHPFLRPNKAKGNYTDAEHYLDVQFRLYREDFVQPLRKGVEDFLEFRDEYIRSDGRSKRRDVNQNSSVRVYKGVTFREKAKSPGTDDSCSYLFNLPEKLVQKVNWAKSKRLLPGSLVLLTSDFCHTASFATVLIPPIDRKNEKKKWEVDPRRQELIRGILRVSIEAGSEFIQLNKSYIMLECEAYFEAYRYNLNILQNMNLAEFPLEKFLISPETSVAAAPSYFYKGRQGARQGAGDKENVTIDLKIKLPFFATVTVPAEATKQINDMGVRSRSSMLSLKSISNGQQLCRVSIRDTESWPAPEIQQKMSMDENQYNAYRAALTSELAIIQGPPGTGKTFIGTKIVQTILLNKKKKNEHNPHCVNNDGNYPNSPILVVCYTNHALDQFLDLLHTHEKNLNMVRVGHTKTETLASCTLVEHRRKLQKGSRYKMATQQQRRVYEALDNLKESETKLESLQAEIEALSSYSAVINFSNLDKSVQDELNRYVPEGIRKMSKSCWLLFLGLTDTSEGYFGDPWYSATWHLKSFFKLKVQGQPEMRHNIVSLQAGHLGAQLVDNSHLLENLDFETEQINFQEEEYDFDELVEQRVLDMYTEDYGYYGCTYRVPKFRLPFFEDWSVDSLPVNLNRLSSDIDKFQRNLATHCLKEHEHQHKKKKKKRRTN